MGHRSAGKDIITTASTRRGIWWERFWQRYEKGDVLK